MNICIYINSAFSELMTSGPAAINKILPAESKEACRRRAGRAGGGRITVIQLNKNLIKDKYI